VIRTSGLDHVHVSVADVERSVRFYAELFGATEAFRVGDALVFVELPDGAGILALDGRADDERNPEHFGLPVADKETIDAAIEAVERTGGRLVERGEHAPNLPYAYVADPDGNVFEL
jgi:catechol 2,3-dioxygenase-like lactoylglutathione lyase family enzyme